MKIIRSIFALTFIFTSHSLQANNDVEQGEKLYKTYCSACHGSQGGMDMNKRVAPPIIAVKMHYIGPYPDKASFAAAVADWVETRDANKTLMRGAIRRFNIMPPVSISRQETLKVAAYIYEGDIENPPGFDDHYQQMHGKQRMGSGM